MWDRGGQENGSSKVISLEFVKERILSCCEMGVGKSQIDIRRRQVDADGRS